jgi:hypothetical protein
MTTQLVNEISALDQAHQASDQTIINELKKQRDLFKTAFFIFAEELQQIEAQKASLQERLVVQIGVQNPLKESGITPDIAATIDLPAIETVSQDAASDLMAEIQATVTAIDHYEPKIQELTQETIEKCTRQRDVYKNGLYQLKRQVEESSKELGLLEEQLAKQAASKKIEHNPADDLARDVSKVKISRITAKDKDAVLHNLILMLYQEKNPTIDLDQLNEKDPNLIKSAQEALNIIEMDMPPAQRSDPMSYQSIIRSLLSSKERNVTHKSLIQQGSKKSFAEVERETTSVIAQAKGIFAQFYSKRQRQLQARKKQPEEEAQYADFPFNTVAFLAGQLCLLQKILEGCKSKLDSKSLKIIEVEKELKNIQSVQASFFALLKKCRLPKSRF